MIDKASHEVSWIQDLSQKLEKRGDPKILEKVIYAFSLLEQLKLTGLEFIFKGGTSLLLLSSPPRRFSIDIDIITPIHPSELPAYLEKIVASGKFSKWVDDNKRKHVINAPIRHYKFYYTSKIGTAYGEEPILLDVLFATNPYPKLVELPITHDWLKTEGIIPTVKIPAIESILGDKLTAFAPSTTGILYEKNRPVEIIKQLYDISFLIDQAIDFELVKTAYIKNANEEIRYRGLQLDWRDTLRDSFLTCLTISKRDSRNINFLHLQKGISNIVNFILERFRLEEAIVCSAKTAYLSRLLQSEDLNIDRYSGPHEIGSLIIEASEYSKLNKLKKNLPEAYYYWHKAITLPVKEFSIAS